MTKLLLGVSMGALLSMAEMTSAGAVTSLTLENPGLQSYQQTQNSPCIIGDNSCNDPTGWTHTTEPSGGTPITYDLLSPIYTVQQILNAITTRTFQVGIDVNSTTKPPATEELDLFTMS